MYHKKYSHHLAREKVIEQICEVPQPMRKTLKVWLNKSIADRDASDRWAQAHPEHLKVTDAQCELMLQAHGAGVSYRALELVFHLRCQSGNSAQRCCWRAEALQQETSRCRQRKSHAA